MDTSQNLLSKVSLSKDNLDELRKDILTYCTLNVNGLNHDRKQLTKEEIRSLYHPKRIKKLVNERIRLKPFVNVLVSHFANGDEVEPDRINPILIPVVSSDETGFLFRFASLLWAVPLSRGFGRRMRFLIVDEHNNRLMGIFALGDPVFNLGIRDKWIGWTVQDRKDRLVNVMDAYTVGAVPPYTQILCGKLITLLIGSSEVSQVFDSRYGNTKGTISGLNKNARLALVTISSVFGRSSIYNRLKLFKQNYDKPKTLLVELEKIGFTKGYGHFQFPDEIFERLANLLKLIDHPYVKSYEYGQGANWKFRMIRVGLETLGLDVNLLNHGIRREVYAMPMSENCRDFLCGRTNKIEIDRPTINQITDQALKRWIIPRSRRFPEYRNFTREQILDMMLWKI